MKALNKTLPARLTKECQPIRSVGRVRGIEMQKLGCKKTYIERSAHHAKSLHRRPRIRCNWLDAMLSTWRIPTMNVSKGSNTCKSEKKAAIHEEEGDSVDDCSLYTWSSSEQGPHDSKDRDPIQKICNTGVRMKHGRDPKHLGIFPVRALMRARSLKWARTVWRVAHVITCHFLHLWDNSLNWPDRKDFVGGGSGWRRRRRGRFRKRGRIDWRGRRGTRMRRHD